MSNLKLIVKPHYQSGKDTEYISILGREFIYRDKRGHSMHTKIDYEFAMQIIDTFPAKLGRTGIPIKMLDRLSSNPNHRITLKWHYFGENKYELMIHSIGHVYTSQFIQ